MDIHFTGQVQYAPTKFNTLKPWTMYDITEDNVYIDLTGHGGPWFVCYTVPCCVRRVFDRHLDVKGTVMTIPDALDLPANMDDTPVLEGLDREGPALDVIEALDEDPTLGQTIELDAHLQVPDDSDGE